MPLANSCLRYSAHTFGDRILSRGEGKENGPFGSFAPPLKNPLKMHCNSESCSFTYVGVRKKTPGVRKKTFSAIKEHAEWTGHEVAKTDVNILGKGIKNYDKRRFLEALHSVLDKNAVNEHIEFPVSYLPLLESIESNGIRHKRT